MLCNIEKEGIPSSPHFSYTKVQGQGPQSFQEENLTSEDEEYDILEKVERFHSSPTSTQVQVDTILHQTQEDRSKLKSNLLKNYMYNYKNLDDMFYAQCKHCM